MKIRPVLILPTEAAGSSWILPENARYQELRGHNEPPIEDIPAALRAALEAPIHEKPLRGWLQPGDAVTLIISDMSRFWMRQVW